jgi:hypothetical protein
MLDQINILRPSSETPASHLLSSLISLLLPALPPNSLPRNHKIKLNSFLVSLASPFHPALLLTLQFFQLD